VHKEVFQAPKVSDEVFVSDAECSFNKARVWQCAWQLQFCHSFFPYLPLQHVSDSQVRLFCTVHHDAAIVMNPIPTHNSDVYKVLLKKEGMEKWLVA
jgi:hypothetical protein